MTYPREIKLARVLELLEACAVGHERRISTHRLLIVWNDKCFALPKGDHKEFGKQKIGTSQVRSMVAQLEISTACADEHLQELAGSFR